MYSAGNTTCKLTPTQWRHWGCVTPSVIHNWKITSDGDMDLVDGYDELPAELQEKVKRAFDQGHVDDEDFTGVSIFG